MKRIWFLFLPLLLVVACKIETEIWLDRTGKGHGVITLKEFEGWTEDEIKEKIVSPGMEIISIEKKGEGNFVVKVKWDDFKKAFDKGEFRKEKGGKIFVNFGKLENIQSGSVTMLEQVLTVHVDGKIIETTGEKIDKNTVVFKEGEATLTYKPAGFSLLPLFVILIFVVAVVIILIIFLFLRRKKPQEIPEESR